MYNKLKLMVMEKIKIEPKEFWDDKKWVEKNYSDLQDKYPDKWVAIVDKKVVAAGKSLKDIELEAEHKTGVSRDRIPVLFIEGEVNILFERFGNENLR